MFSTKLWFLSALWLCVSGVQSAVAAEPNVRNVNVRGLQVSGTTTITIDGDEFGKTPKLLLPFPANQTLNPKSTDKQAIFDVALDDQVPPGYHHLRVVNEGGVSLPVLIGVDALPQRLFAADAGTLPVALHGSVGGSGVLETTFAGKAGQKVMIEVESHRIGGKLRPVLHLYGPKKLQLAWAWGTPELMADTRLEATLPEDGLYKIALHDSEYAAPAPGFFRLKIGQWRSVDRVFPPIVSKESKSLELLGPGEPVKLDLPAKRNPFEPLPWPKGHAWSGFRPFVETSTRAELLPGDDAMSGMLKAGNFAVSDRITKPFDEIRFRVPVVPNTKVRFEVFAERLGSPLDAALVIRDDKGTVITRVEDGPGTLDPVLEYAVPDKVTAVFVGVADSQGRVGSNAAFRLTVDPVTGNGPRPDFRLFTPTQRASIPLTSRFVIPVFAERQNFKGKIDLTATDLATGMNLSGNVIAPDADGTLITITRTAASGDANLTTWRGTAGELERQVIVRGHPLEKAQPWLASEIAIASTTTKAEEFAIDWRSLTDSAVLKPGDKLALPVKVSRPDPNTVVRLTLLTSQAPVLVNNQPDPARTIRAEKPVELAAKVSDGEMTILLPPELPADAYDIALQAETLTPDKTRVLATAFTTVRRMPVRLPVAVKLTTPARIDVKAADPTPQVVEIKGEVMRSEGSAGDVTITLVNPPPATVAPPIVVKAGETAFTLKTTLPANLTAGEFIGIKLSASVVPDPKQPAVRVKSRDIVLSLNIVGAK